MELNKRKAEFEFKKSVFGSDHDKELEAVRSGAAELAGRARAAGIETIQPCQSKLDELARLLDGFSPQEIKDSIKARSGRPYELLHERGVIVKSNHDNRLETAKIWLLAARMKPDDRKRLLDTLAAGAVASQLAFECLDDASVKRLSRFMQRCGIQCSASGKSLDPGQETQQKEVRVEVSNRNVWVSETVVPQLRDNLAKIYTLNSKIQLKNAERQIKDFNDEEEQDFAALQRQYLDLLKQQDELLRESKDEESITVTLQ